MLTICYSLFFWGLTMQPMIRLLLPVMRQAGDLINQALNRGVEHVRVQEKSSHDYVTEIDMKCEALLIKKLHDLFPSYSILSEEAGLLYADGKEPEKQWVIDPLDGTTNFMHALPHFAISIALVINGKPDQAIIYNPLLDELFYASAGQGACLNQRRIRIAQRNHFQGALLATSLSSRHVNLRQLKILHAMLGHFGAVRSTGSAVLDLAYIAANRLDGLWLSGLKPWDTAAGELIVREAGGYYTDLSTVSDDFSQGDIIAGSQVMHDYILDAVRGA